MAPVASATQPSAPLADYFWIAGIDSDSLLQVRANSGDRASSNGAPAPPVASTIAEDSTLEEEEPPSPRGRANASSESRRSIQSTTSPDPKLTGSNRSSATIKAPQLGGSGLSDADFDVALRKFASERESFLDDLSFSAGTVTTPRSKPRAKPPRIVGEDASTPKSGAESIKRRISFRDMNSMKRAPSIARQASIRTSKRLSNYNSVIPTPQPLNADSNMHPLKRKFEPVLLDRYPSHSVADEAKRRGPFPDYIPMFAFPNDINIVSSDDRPRSTWHGFAMTSGDNSRIYGICVTIWLPLKQEAAEELERQCEEWRRDNMSDEERELASSLGERLAAERAKLSRLLTQLPTVPSGSAARESLEEEIGQVEEKITLMTDLLRPVRHGAASKIDGLTDGDSGFWIPRAYGVLGRDANLTSFWKEWLRAIVVPMTQGAVLRVPPTSPKAGMWQPLERYVVNLCTEALSPMTSKTQVEIAVRELRLFARKEAVNELPGSRNTDLYALFRALSIQNIVILFEAALSESRIIFLSSHTAMLHLACKALTSLLYPLVWAGVYIPILPARLLQALEAPCPYIVGIERRYDNIELPDDDFLMVDLDHDQIEATALPPPLPRQQRRKLVSLLQVAAPHHYRYGVPTGPPAYAVETYPFDAVSTENSSIYTQNPAPSNLNKYVSQSSTSFGAPESQSSVRPPIFNAFLHARNNDYGRPSTSTTIKGSAPPSPKLSPTSSQFAQPPATAISRTDSGYGIQATLREKRSGHFDVASRRSSSFGLDRKPTLRRPSMPFGGHAVSHSTSTLNDNQSTSHYAPSTYAPSTLAASTVMPNILMQPVRNTQTQTWVEGHCLNWKPHDERSICSVCDERAEEGIYRCMGCNMFAHGRCSQQICIVCPGAFYPDQVRAAFVRCFASLFYTYRKSLHPATGEQRKNGQIYHFNMDGYLKSMPRENAEYLGMLLQTQGFNEFIHERECKRPNDPSIVLFDEIILSKKNRGRSSLFSKSVTNFLCDTTDHIWRSAAATPPSSRFPGDYRQVVSRIPAKLDPTLMKEPRVIQGVPRINNTKARRKPIPSMLGPSGDEDPVNLSHLSTHSLQNSLSPAAAATNVSKKSDSGRLG
ncbi:dDENN domain-containing protein [Xylona heveae TC161]|uniref:DDENN domain-containing protein n=1 Tax=Xylona heveae (strain CBS 132557 / TC161) TaxID=1328760 RepID=A0A165J515_XYLHT|nr:dDENN domain-containing protein [Xylona heveae TC161]KZF25739.1 dDENN domain-containing protein [Xylona heveae TC161]